MQNSRSRMGAAAAVFAGAMFVAGGVLTLVYPHPPVPATGSYEALNVLGTVVISAAYLGVLGTLLGLRTRRDKPYGRFGGAGYFLATVGSALLFVGQATSVILAGNDALGWLFDRPGYGFLVGISFLLLGLLLLGITTLRSGILPRSCGIALVGVVAASILGPPLSAGLGFVVVGLLWMVLGYVLWLPSVAPAVPAR